MTIPLVDLVAQYDQIRDEVEPAVLDVLRSGRYILGPNVGLLETEVAAFLGAAHAVGVASGTDALVISLRAAGVKPGDEVILPAYSFFATAGCVLAVGARPVFVDVDPQTFLMDAAQCEAVVSPRTRAVIPVHLYGQPADMDAILAVARKHDLIVIEDNAQAFGADFGGAKTGAIGQLGCLSFFPSKNLGAYGDGGMVITSDAGLAERARMLRTHGWKKKYFPELLGYNSRLDELQAAILRVKLAHLEAWNRRRRELARRYADGLGGLELQLPTEAENRTHVFFVYMVGFERRDQVRAALSAAGIASEVYFPQPLHLTEPCNFLGYRAGQFPAAESASRRLLALPMYPELSEAQVERVCTAVAQAVRAA